MPSSSEKFQKTAALLGTAAFFMSPFSSKVGMAGTLSMKVAGLTLLHEYGRYQPGQPVANNMHQFFNTDIGKTVGSIVGNIVKGGSAVVDSIFPTTSSK